MRDGSQRTTLINAIRSHLAEFGIVAPIGRKGVEKLLQAIDEPKMVGFPMSPELAWRRLPGS